MIPATQETISGLKGALAYVRAYREKTFVVKLGGEVLADARALESIAMQVALFSSLGIRVVLVHGGGPQATALIRRLGHEERFVAGRRVTDDVALEAVTMVFAGQLNTTVCCALRRHGVAAVGLSGVDADLITARRRPPSPVVMDDGRVSEVDYGHVGDIESVDPSILTHLVGARFLPVIASLASDAEGNVYNVNADTVAEAVAVAVSAQKLVYLTGVPGLLRRRDDPSTLISFADADELAPLMRDGTIGGGMRPKIEACLRAVARGVERTHVIDGRAPDALLLEVFTGRGIGTMIVQRKETTGNDNGDA